MALDEKLINIAKNGTASEKSLILIDYLASINIKGYATISSVEIDLIMKTFSSENEKNTYKKMQQIEFSLRHTAMTVKESCIEIELTIQIIQMINGFTEIAKQNDKYFLFDLYGNPTPKTEYFTNTFIKNLNIEEKINLIKEKANSIDSICKATLMFMQKNKIQITTYIEFFKEKEKYIKSLKTKNALIKEKTIEITYHNASQEDINNIFNELNCLV